jgi:hypothetical protein
MKVKLSSSMIAFLVVAPVSWLFLASCSPEGRSTEAVPGPTDTQASPSEQFFTFTPFPLDSKSEISCRPIALTYIGQGNVLATPDGRLRQPDETAYRLSARIEKGTDVLSIRIERDHLLFLTKAAFETGLAEGSRFQLLENNSDYLKASASLSSGVATLESFVLNKQNGLAIWTRIRPAGFLGQVAPAAPDSDTMYFSCL